MPTLQEQLVAVADVLLQAAREVKPTDDATVAAVIRNAIETAKAAVQAAELARAFSDATVGDDEPQVAAPADEPFRVHCMDCGCRATYQDLFRPGVEIRCARCARVHGGAARG